jgi:hypothetical protein
MGTVGRERNFDAAHGWTFYFNGIGYGQRGHRFLLLSSQDDNILFSYKGVPSPPNPRHTFVWLWRLNFARDIQECTLRLAAVYVSRKRPPDPAVSAQRHLFGNRSLRAKRKFRRWQAAVLIILAL